LEGSLIVTVLGSLREEHAFIGRVLDAAERYAEKLDRDQHASLDDLRGFAAFITDFGELWHHAKEEEFLIPELVRHGVAWDHGPVAHARQEHEQESYLARVLVQLAAQTGGGPDEAERRREVLAALRGYIEFQRHHMREEEAVLYPCAAKTLTDAALDDIERRCRELESHRFGGKRYEEVRAAATNLIQRHS
jgi:hemerythrin-like domain-containing protein